MSQIPITKEYAAAVGEWCERVESRSLLLNKFAFPKNWGDGNKENSASFWSLMRIASNGSVLLQQKASDLERKANGWHIETEEKKQRLLGEARHCRSLANTKTGSTLDSIRPKHTARFLELLRASHSAENLRIIEGRLEGRLAINLAEGLIQNGGLNLDRIFGLPLINGSSVKGVARSAALEELNAKRDDATLETFVRVFGAGESDWKGDLNEFADIDKNRVYGNKKLGIPIDLKGAVIFLQAVPTNDAKIVVDITNVHTPDYYRTGNERDLAKEQPKPNYFPAVERGTEFAFPILLSSGSVGVHADRGPVLLAAAERWLSAALAQRGLGAKTAAGYGWFTDITAEVAERNAKAEAECNAKAQAEQARAEEKAKEEAEAAKRREGKAAAAEFDKLPPAAQLAQIASNDGKFENFFKAKFKTLSDDDKAAIVQWFATPDGTPYWLKIKNNNRRIWPQVVPELHRVKKTKGLKLP
jgi:CRISPR type III-B/RAMP module RAMP protein Cmr6